MGCHPVAVHIYTQTIHSTTQITTEQQQKMVGCGPCPVFASFTLAFALQLRKKHGKTSVRVRKTSVTLRKTSVTLRKTSVTLQKPHSQYKNLSHSTKTSVTVQKPQSQYKNLSHSTETSVTLQKPQSKYSIHITKILGDDNVERCRNL